MERPMRRKRQQTTEEAALAMLASAPHCVLACVDEDGEPYAVPVSHAVDGDTVWIHSARSGHKLACVEANPQVSLCAVLADDIVPEHFTTEFASVIAFGSARVLDDEESKLRCLNALAAKYCPDVPGLAEEIAGGIKRCVAIAVRIERITGKEAIEIVRRRKDAEA